MVSLDPRVHKDLKDLKVKLDPGVIQDHREMLDLMVRMVLLERQGSLERLEGLDLPGLRVLLDPEVTRDLQVHQGPMA